jgi:[ribosomal protein S18]-alanine N-acetyltransferase
MASSDLDITLRELVDGDLDEIHELEQLIFPDAWPRSAFVDILEENAWGALIAEIDGRIVGYACHLIVAGDAHLANMAVHPDYRRKSVARRLLDSILRLALDESCEQILLEVRPSNEAARKFYERAGFIELYRRTGYYHRPREDALVMIKNLVTDTDDG